MVEWVNEERERSSKLRGGIVEMRNRKAFNGTEVELERCYRRLQ